MEETPHFSCALRGNGSGLYLQKGKCCDPGDWETGSVRRMDPDRVWMLNFDLCYVSQSF